MSLTADLGLGVLFILAFGNGANDVGKSIVALMTDPETSTFRPRYSPLVWGGLFSGLGSVAAILISVRLFSAFAPSEFSPDSSWVFFHSSSACRCCRLDLARNSTQNSSLDNARDSRRHNRAGYLFVRELWSAMVFPHLENPSSSSGRSICRPSRSLHS